MSSLPSELIMVGAVSTPDPSAFGPTLSSRLPFLLTMSTRSWTIAVVVPPIFHQYHYLRGFEQWMIDVKLNPGVHEAIASHIYHINATLTMRLLEKIGDYTDIVSTGDDFGTSTSSYMSPADFRALVKERETARQENRDVPSRYEAKIVTRRGEERWKRELHRRPGQRDEQAGRRGEGGAARVAWGQNWVRFFRGGGEGGDVSGWRARS